MKQSSTTAFLLTFLVALLVLVAALVFLARDNQVLEQHTADLESRQAELAASNDQLTTDLAVRESALNTAEAARDALANEISGHVQQVEALSTQVARQETNVAEAEAAVNAPNIQLFIFSPNDGAVITPKTEIEFFIAAYADDGVSSIEVSLNGEQIESYQVEEQQVSTVYRFNWSPEVEGSYTIQAVGTDLNGRMSEAMITITATYPSEEARLEGLRQEVELSIESIRLPELDEEIATETVPLQPVTPTTDLNLHQQILLGSSSYSQAAAQLNEIVYRALRLIPDDFDYVAYANNLSEQEIIGAYNPDTLAVVAYYPDLGGPEVFNRWLIAHSEVHYLQYDAFGLGQIDFQSLTTEKRIALQAMMEGEANFVQNIYLQNGEAFSMEEQDIVNDTLNQRALILFNELPSFFHAQFEFFYRYGFQFIQYLFERGGFELVNDMWINPPESSEEILHPETYIIKEIPELVTLTLLDDILDENWKFISKDTLGEFHLRQHLSLHLLQEEIEPAASGWGNDNYIIYQNIVTNEVVMALRLAWDGPGDPAEFTTAYNNYLRRQYLVDPELQLDGGQCWQGEDVTCLYQFGSQTFVVRAPNVETARNIAAVQNQ